MATLYHFTDWVAIQTILDVYGCFHYTSRNLLTYPEEHMKNSLKIMNVFAATMFVFSWFCVRYVSTACAGGSPVVLKAAGKGLVPENMKGKQQGLMMAKRAALMDAYRNMAKMLYGSEKQESGGMVIESLNGLVQGAQVTKEECKKDSCTIEITLTYQGLVKTHGNALRENGKLRKLILKLKKENARLKKELSKQK